MSVSSSVLHQGPPETALKLHFVGRRVEEVDGPAAILDVAVARKNCEAMLRTAERLGVRFRAHVKTHKTTQLTKLQVGEPGPVRMVASTVAEIEQLVPFLLECTNKKRPIDVIYGVPPTPSSLHRLAELSKLFLKNKAGSTIGLLIDHPDTVRFLRQISDEWPTAFRVFIKVDTGYHRSGVTPESSQFEKLLNELSKGNRVQLHGFYSHLGSSYGGNSPSDALHGLIKEIEGTEAAAAAAKQRGLGISRYILSVGASPTATAAQNLLSSDTREGKTFNELVGRICRAGHAIELHAGVYPVLDLQQLATHARPSSVPSNADVASLSTSDIALRILVEVASLYPDREKPEALIAAGSIALGREPCKSYPGWAVVTPWKSRNNNALSNGVAAYSEEQRTGWIVGRISQEHGILSWEGPTEDIQELQIGQKLLLWPNHACMAGAGYGWYLVVDSDGDDPDIIRDVWVRCRGW